MKNLNIAFLLLTNVYCMEKTTPTINIKSSNRTSPDPELLAAYIIYHGKGSPGSPVCTTIIADPDFLNRLKAKRPVANDPK